MIKFNQNDTILSSRNWSTARFVQHRQPWKIN